VADLIRARPAPNPAELQCPEAGERALVTDRFEAALSVREAKT
jgi:hypothetical protein